MQQLFEIPTTTSPIIGHVKSGYKASIKKYQLQIK